jgi:hypothetical protein
LNGTIPAEEAGIFGNFVYTYYYSPETRSLVKYHSEAVSKGAGASAGKTDIELIKFGSKLPK